METQELLGLKRLMALCQRLKIGWVTEPPASAPPAAGLLVMGHPLDPLLAAVYQRFGQVAFATEAAGVVLCRWDDSVNELMQHNRWFQEETQPELVMPLFEFAAESFLAHSYATVPSLADERGRQPVVWVDRYEQPSALPVASDVDTFFGTYASFLEMLVSHPNYRAPMGAPIVFPWHVPELLAQDERLVALLRAGSFNPLLKPTDATRDWVERILRQAP